MSINLSDELHAATTKGKIASAKEVYLDGDKENLQQVGEKTHQMEEAIKDIGVSGGASVATAVSYENANSGLGAITAQAAIDELAAKDKSQDAEIDTKANEGEVNLKIQTINENLDKKFDKSNVVQELGDSEEQVVSQAALPFRYVQNDEFIFAQVDAENHLLFGIQEDGTPVFGKNSTLEDDLISQVNELSAKVSTIIGDNDNTDVIDTLNEMKKFFASISNTQTLSNIINDISDLKTRMNAVETELDKKFDKDNIAQELGDSEDKVVSQLALPFRIEESEEFLYLIKDGEDHVLFGIQQDGSVEWQVGIPSPIRVKIQEIVNQSQQDKTDLSDALNAAKDELNAALQAYKQTTDAAITSLQDAKVDKEEGKSLIDDEVKAFYQVIENEEWMCLMTDEEGHTLFGIKRDTGKPYFPLNEMYQVEQNEEFFALWLDAEDHILMGIRRDGQIIGEIHAVNALKEAISAIQSNIETLQGNITAVEGSVSALNTDVSTIQGNITAVEGSVSALNTKVSTIDSSVKELLDVFSIQDNPEYMSVETDAEGRILASTNADGSHYAHNMKSETIDAKVDKEDGKSLINASVADSQSSFNDVEERMQITTDGDGKIIAYRDKDGVQHEHTLDADTLHVSNLNLKGNSVEDIKSALISSGFNVKTPIDWSNESSIYLPTKPRCAMMNIFGIEAMPTTKTQNLHARAEVWDKNGNYFQKKVILNAQGNSTMLMPKKNFAMDFCEDDWKGDDTTSIKIGNWVVQDSFHFKAYYGGSFMMAGPVAYKLFDKIYKTHDFCSQRPYMDYFANKYTYKDSPVSDTEKNMDIEPRCFPDAFPVIVYLNNKFYGVFSWQLKKHRDNFMMDRNEPLNIHLDGALGFFNNRNTIWDGNISWVSFEVRNPKPKSSKWKLLCQNGTVYNGDSPNELMGTDSSHYDVSDTSCKKSAQTKAAIMELSKYMSEIKVFEDAYSSVEQDNKATALAALKEEIEKRFSIPYLIDYVIMVNLMQNFDSMAKNWQWVTWGEIDGKNRWYVIPYDWDQCFGISGFENFGIPYDYELGIDSQTPAKYPWLYYRDDIKKRYAELRDKNVLSIDSVFGMILDWVNAVGYDNYVLEYKKWNETPCNRDSLISEDWEYTNKTYDTYSDAPSNYSTTKTYTKDECMKVDRRMYKSLKDGNVNHPYTDEEWWEDMCVKPGTYNEGDTVYDGYSNFYQFKALKQITVDSELNGRPFKGFYSDYPREGGTHDSIYRIYKWIVRKFTKFDAQLGYTSK